MTSSLMMMSSCTVDPEEVGHNHVHNIKSWPKEVSGPAPPVRPVQPWPYQFLRRKNGVTGILTYERVAGYIQSSHHEVSAGQSRDHKARPDCSM